MTTGRGAGGESKDGRGTRKWLLIFNCQAYGLANSLEALHPRLQVERYDEARFRRKRDEVLSRAGEFERVVIATRLRGELEAEASSFANVSWVPQVWFQGYQPDLCYLAGRGPLASGPAGPYHSAIVWAAFRSGRDEAATRAMFNADTFEALGYFDVWPSARQQLVDSFAAHGFDVRERFVQWTRNGPFMHTVNHPRIPVLMDLARMVLRSVGVEPQEAGIVPPDNLANGPAFPVYPEIGTRLGVAGSYYFKRGGAYRIFDLKQYIAKCFTVYRAAGDAEPDSAPFLPMLRRARAFMEASR
jgi:hypothetical protein